MKSITLFAFSVLVLLSCKKDAPTPTTNSVPPLSSAKKVYVINEGNYGTPNAGISIFDLGNATVIEDYFKSVNNTQLGDVAQSMCKINGDFYIVVNHSGKIVVCGSDFKVKRTITGLNSPRYIIGVSNSKGYATDLYANGINIIDLNNGTITGSITLPGSTEKMVMLYNKVYVTNTAKDKVYVIDASNNTLIDSVSVGLNASGLVLDKNDKLWVLASGTSTVAGKLSLIDPVNNSVTWSQSFNVNRKAGLLCINGTKDTLWFADKDGLVQMPISSTSVPNAFKMLSNTIYGLGIHPTRFEVYVADALDYVARSKIYVYRSSTGAALGNFQAGFLSNGFYFE
jgi:YVTN family beta-propeller protein